MFLFYFILFYFIIYSNIHPVEPQVKTINNGREDLSAIVNIISYDLAVRAEEGTSSLLSLLVFYSFVFIYS